MVKSWVRANGRKNNIRGVAGGFQSVLKNKQVLHNILYQADEMRVLRYVDNTRFRRLTSCDVFILLLLTRN